MKKALLLLVLMICSTAFAQKLTLVSGNFNFLRDQSEVNVQINYDGMLMMAENITENNYLSNRKRDILANDKKTEKDWVEWNNEWQKYKEVNYLDSFLKGLTPSKKINFGKNLSTKYTLIIDTKWIYPGWYGGFIMQPSKLSTVLRFVESSNPSVTLLEFQGDKIEGIGVKGEKDLVMEYGRVAMAYQKTAKLLLKEINKNVK